MRLSFPNGEHEDVLVEQGEVRIGSAGDNAIAIAADGLSDHHAIFAVDAQRGIVLRLCAGAGGAHVNARPVHRLALLRLGDVVSLGQLQVLVKPSRDSDVRRDVPASSPAAGEGGGSGVSRVVLRGVAGPLFGRSFPLDAPLTIGRGADADVRLDDPALGEQHARLERHADRIVLRDLGSAEGSLVNGVAVRDALLHPGDQLALEHHRFVVEGPGLPGRSNADLTPVPRSGGIGQTLQSVRGASDGPDAATPAPVAGGNVWWLIGAALLIMVALAALLFYAPLLR